MGIDWLNTILVSVSMSVDCMTVGATDGIKEPNMDKRKLFLLTAFFGLFQYAMPTIGYFIFYFVVNYGLSQTVTEKMDKYIPWVAFVLLAFLGVKNIIEWIKEKLEEKKEKDNPDSEGREEVAKPLDFKNIILQSIATSIDALCIGFVYSPLDYSIGQSQLIFGIIGVITFVLSSITTLTGKKVGKYLVKWAGLIAGLVFIGIGLKILIESYL